MQKLVYLPIYVVLEKDFQGRFGVYNESTFDIIFRDHIGMYSRTGFSKFCLIAKIY